MVDPDTAAGQRPPLSSRRLWSLWDMLEFKAKDFLVATSAIQHMRSLIEEWQENQSNTEINKPVSATVADTFKNMLSELSESAAALGTRITRLAIDELIEKLEDENRPRPSHVAQEFKVIQSTLRRELTERVTIALNDDDQRWYRPEKPLFGQEFQDKFRVKGVYELDEAAKCIALGRPTSAVFHLMRLMEIAIDATRKCLSIPDPARPYERTWGNVLKNIKDEGFLKKWPHASARMNGDGAYFEALYASLDAVKNPLRDNTMHVENIYTDTEAKHIFELVKGFAMKLASRMDENGEPKA